MTLLFLTNENLPKVPADVQVYLNNLNAQGFLFDKLYIPDDEKDLELEVYSTVLPGNTANITVCTDGGMAGRITDWAKQIIPE